MYSKIFIITPTATDMDKMGRFRGNFFCHGTFKMAVKGRVKKIESVSMLIPPSDPPPLL